MSPFFYHIKMTKRASDEAHDSTKRREPELDWLRLNRDCWSVIYSLLTSWLDRSALQQTCKHLCRITKSICTRLKFSKPSWECGPRPRRENPWMVSDERMRPWLELPEVRHVKWQCHADDDYTRYVSRMIRARITETKPELELRGGARSHAHNRQPLQNLSLHWLRRCNTRSGGFSLHFKSIRITCPETALLCYDLPWFEGVHLLVGMPVSCSAIPPTTQLEKIITAYSADSKPNCTVTRPRTMKFTMNYVEDAANRDRVEEAERRVTALLDKLSALIPEHGVEVSWRPIARV